MSIEQAQAFIEKVKNDEDLAKRFNEAEDGEGRLNIAREMGYEFSPEEVRQASDQLTPEQFDNLAAGGQHTEGCSGYCYLNAKGFF